LSSSDDNGGTVVLLLPGPELLAGRSGADAAVRLDGVVGDVWWDADDSGRLVGVAADAEDDGDFLSSPCCCCCW